MSNREAKQFYETACCDRCDRLLPTEYLHTAGGCSICTPRVGDSPETEETQ